VGGALNFPRHGSVGGAEEADGHVLALEAPVHERRVSAGKQLVRALALRARSLTCCLHRLERLLQLLVVVAQVLELGVLADVGHLPRNGDSEEDADGERDEDSRQRGHVVAQAEHPREGT